MPIRQALHEDLPAIVAIYNQSIPARMATADLEPVRIVEREAWFRSFTPDKRPLWVMENEGQIAGWLSLKDFYGRPAYRHTVEIGLYVADQWQGRGVGRALVTYAIDASPALDIHTLLSFTFGHNHPSLALFRSAGFEDWGILPDIAVLDGQARNLIILGKRIIKTTNSTNGDEKVT